MRRAAAAAAGTKERQRHASSSQLHTRGEKVTSTTMMTISQTKAPYGNAKKAKSRGNPPTRLMMRMPACLKEPWECERGI